MVKCLLYQKNGRELPLNFRKKSKKLKKGAFFFIFELFNIIFLNFPNPKPINIIYHRDQQIELFHLHLYLAKKKFFEKQNKISDPPQNFPKKCSRMAIGGFYFKGTQNGRTARD